MLSIFVLFGTSVCMLCQHIGEFIVYKSVAFMNEILCYFLLIMHCRLLYAFFIVTRQRAAAAAVAAAMAATAAASQGAGGGASLGAFGFPGAMNAGGGPMDAHNLMATMASFAAAAGAGGINPADLQQTLQNSSLASPNLLNFPGNANSASNNNLMPSTAAAAAAAAAASGFLPQPNPLAPFGSPFNTTGGGGGSSAAQMLPPPKSSTPVSNNAAAAGIRLRTNSCSPSLSDSGVGGANVKPEEKRRRLDQRVRS